MKKGFTLTEMIAVIGIIALMSLMILPRLLNQVNEKRKEISETTKQIIYSAADLYLNNDITLCTKSVNNVCYVKLSKLAELNYFSAPLEDVETGNEIDLNKCVRVIVDEYNQYGAFEIDECQ